MKCDVIVPIFYTNGSFRDNIRSWIDSIPIRRLFLGLGNKETIKEIEEIASYIWLGSDIDIQQIDQSDHKTLGYCMKELINEVKTEWFVYLHDDVKLPENWFKDMMELRDGADVLESLKEPINQVFIDQVKGDRAYSGAQIMKTEIIREIIKDWEDNWIYTLEDIIIYHRLRLNGYSYKKIPVYHEHQGHEIERTVDRKTLLWWQIQALVKYLPLDDYTINMFDSPFQVLKHELLEEWKKNNEM